jgi:hypothetical protein
MLDIVNDTTAINLEKAGLVRKMMSDPDFRRLQSLEVEIKQLDRTIAIANRDPDTVIDLPDLTLN